MNWLKRKLFIDKAEAIALGMTHEGRMFGLPAWFRNPDSNEFLSAPKFVPSHYWFRFCDFALDVYAWFLPSDKGVTIPMIVTGPIV